MNRKAHRDRAQREAIAEFRGSSRAAYQFGANLQTAGSDDVGLLAVLVLQQGEPGGPARIIFDSRYRGFDAVFVPFEVHEANLLLMPAANAAGGDASIDITPARPLAYLDQALLRFAFGNVAVI